jgi:hypothetical protein
MQECLTGCFCKPIFELCVQLQFKGTFFPWYCYKHVFEWCIQHCTDFSYLEWIVIIFVNNLICNFKLNNYFWFRSNTFYVPIHPTKKNN